MSIGTPTMTAAEVDAWEQSLRAGTLFAPRSQNRRCVCGRPKDRDAARCFDCYQERRRGS